MLCVLLLLLNGCGSRDSQACKTLRFIGTWIAWPLYLIYHFGCDEEESGGGGGGSSGGSGSSKGGKNQFVTTPKSNTCGPGGGNAPQECCNNPDSASCSPPASYQTAQTLYAGGVQLSKAQVHLDELKKMASLSKSSKFGGDTPAKKPSPALEVNQGPLHRFDKKNDKPLPSSH